MPSLPRVSTGCSLMVVAAFALAACGSDSSSNPPAADAGGVDAATDAHADTGGPADAANPQDSSSQQDAALGNFAACAGACGANNPAGFQKFAGYDLAQCGCAAGAPCATQCNNECTNPGSTIGGTCGACLTTEASKRSGSACSTSAATMCEADATCKPYADCLSGC